MKSHRYTKIVRGEQCVRSGEFRSGWCKPAERETGFFGRICGISGGCVERGGGGCPVAESTGAKIIFAMTPGHGFRK